MSKLLKWRKATYQADLHTYTYIHTHIHRQYTERNQHVLTNITKVVYNIMTMVIKTVVH